MRYKDLTNQQFGNLLVLGENYEKNKLRKETKNPNIFWECKCIKCGQYKSMYSTELNKIKKLGTKGCNCGNGNRFIDLTGNKYNLLKVLYKDEERSTKNKIYWICECECGNLCSKQAGLLKNRKNQSCGCLTFSLSSKARKKYNKYNLTGEYGIGYSSNTDSKFYFDLEDYDKIKDHCWYENQHGYLETRWNSNSRKFLHNIIINIKTNTNKIVDHKNRKVYDCRKENLRICTSHQNIMNRGLDNRNKSGVSGIQFNKNCNKWQSVINYNGSRIELGLYKDFKDAVKVRLIAEEKYFGEFAPQLHLYEELNIVDDKIMPIKSSKKKRVLCLENNKEYISAIEAGEELNIPPNLINAVARGDKLSTHKLHFKYT